MHALKPTLQEGAQRTGISLATDRDKLLIFSIKQNETNKKSNHCEIQKGFYSLWRLTTCKKTEYLYENCIVGTLVYSGVIKRWRKNAQSHNLSLRKHN